VKGEKDGGERNKAKEEEKVNYQMGKEHLLYHFL